MAKEKATKTVFCDSCRQDTDHSVTENVGEHNETELTCKACGSFIKVPGDLTEAEQKQHLEDYRAANAGDKEAVGGEEPATDDLKGDSSEEAPAE